MLQFVIILILNACSFAGNRQTQTIYSTHVVAVEQISADNIQVDLGSESGYYFEDDTILDLLGKIQTNFEFPANFQKAIRYFYYTESESFIRKLLLWHCIDLPPPRS